MNLLNIAFLAGIILANGAFACTPPQNSNLGAAINAKIPRHYSSEFPGSNRIMEQLNEEAKAGEVIHSKDSKPSCATETAIEIVATASCKRTSSTSPRRNLAVTTNTGFPPKIQRQLAPDFNLEL